MKKNIPEKLTMKNLKNSLKLFILLILFSCSKEIEDKNNNNKINVLFIMTDDLNCDLGYYGHPQVISPNIDRLASQGVVFENAHIQYPLCGPSRASFMTGMYSDQTKHTKLNVDIRTTIPDVITLGQRFRQQNYRSVRIGKIFHYDNPGSIGSSSSDDIYTWDYTINPWGRDKEEEYKINTLSPRQYGGTLSWMEAEGDDEEQTDGIVANEAIEQLEKFSKNVKMIDLGSNSLVSVDYPDFAKKVSKKITESINIPTIGIGSSNFCDGQILVTDDLLGLTDNKIKFVKKYADLKSNIRKAVKKFKLDVKKGSYPSIKYSY